MDTEADIESSQNAKNREVKGVAIVAEAEQQWRKKREWRRVTRGSKVVGGENMENFNFICRSFGQINK